MRIERSLDGMMLGPPGFQNCCPAGDALAVELCHHALESLEGLNRNMHTSIWSCPQPWLIASRSRLTITLPPSWTLLQGCIYMLTKTVAVRPGHRPHQACMVYTLLNSLSFGISA